MLSLDKSNLLSAGKCLLIFYFWQVTLNPLVNPKHREFLIPHPGSLLCDCLSTALVLWFLVCGPDWALVQAGSASAVSPLMRCGPRW